MFARFPVHAVVSTKLTICTCISKPFGILVDLFHCRDFKKLIILLHVYIPTVGMTNVSLKPRL